MGTETPYGSVEILIRRATSAHFHAAAMSGDRSPRTPGPESRVDQIKGHYYVVLEDDAGLIGVYRVHNTGVLRIMRRPPQALSPHIPSRSTVKRPDREAS